MPQPCVYSPEQILDAAFALLREHGWKQLSVRAVARRLGSSTMPIYSHVHSMEELGMRLRDRTLALQQGYQTRPRTGDVLLDLAVGYVLFARDEKHLFAFLYLDGPGPPPEPAFSPREEFRATFGDESPPVQALAGISPGIQDTLIRYAGIFTHGLAMRVYAGHNGAPSDDTIQECLRDAGEAFALWARDR